MEARRRGIHRRLYSDERVPKATLIRHWRFAILDVTESNRMRDKQAHRPQLSVEIRAAFAESTERALGPQ